MLHDRAEKKKPDKDDFTDLANRVEEFTLRFLDPLKYEKEARRSFFNNPETSRILNTAIKLEQKKVTDKKRVLIKKPEGNFGCLM